MSEEDIKQMAQDAGGVVLSKDRWVLDSSELVRFANLIAAAEREACAAAIRARENS